MANCVTVASSGLPFKEHFTDTVWRDPDRTSAEWRVCEHALMQGFQQTPWQSANQPWERRILDEQGYDTRSIVVGDLNDDGYLDIVTANYGDANLLYFGKGDGTFTPGVPLGSDTRNTEDIALGDLNGDGHPDIVEGNSNESNYFYTNKGDGTFQAPVAFSGDPRDTRAVALGDVNNDGWMEVVFANNGRTPQCYYNDKGVFKEAVDIGEEALPANAILIHDVNRDSWPDLVLGNWQHPVRLFINDGNGSFGNSTPITGDILKTRTLAAGDFHNDGRQEIIVGNFAAAACVFSAGPKFQWTASKFSSNPSLTVDIALGDLDGNGFIDVVKAEDSLAYRYYLNRGDGTFAPGTAFFDGTQSPACVALADLDGDGLLDIVAGQVHVPNCVYLNQGCMHPFIGARCGALDASSQGATSMIAGDFNGDTLPDIIAGIMNERIRLYLGNGQGGFSEGIPLTHEKQATTSVAAG
ncbi:MAG TPA: VCBS repeat-containing protein, partial [Candidatus Hydrogenedentes bacterium]|nr:VCBS repeat-containing protein [Candidatus Hydrogenedentota bacterium]